MTNGSSSRGSACHRGPYSPSLENRGEVPCSARDDEPFPTLCSLVLTSHLPRLTFHLLLLTSHFSLLTSHLLGVQFQPRLEILPYHHAHIHPPQRVTLQHDAAHAEARTHCPSVRWVPTTDEDLSGIDQAIGVSEEHHIQPLMPEHAGRHASGARPAGSVQDLDQDAMVRGRHYIRMTHNPFRPGMLKQHRAAAGTDQDAGRNQCEAEVVAARLFQNRKVGSGMGHPERTR